MSTVPPPQSTTMYRPPKIMIIVKTKKKKMETVMRVGRRLQVLINARDSSYCLVVQDLMTRAWEKSWVNSGMILIPCESWTVRVLMCEFRQTWEQAWPNKQALQGGEVSRSRRRSRGWEVSRKGVRRRAATVPCYMDIGQVSERLLDDTMMMMMIMLEETVY